MPRIAALFRKSAYSPNQHRANDTAILEDTLSHLESGEWEVVRAGEDEVEGGHIPEAELYLNMCQGEVANRRLLALEQRGAILINRPSSVLGCHRNELVSKLSQTGVAFPATEIHDLDGDGSFGRLADSVLLRAASAAGQSVWMKRGDVHAERTEDVVATAAADVSATARAFAGRGIARVALQEHVAGPVIKFYALANRRFFRYYDSATGPGGPPPCVDEMRMRALVFEAAELLGLDVFGGDVAVRSEQDPVLIDLNDWPSFAPYRDEAAAAIAEFVRHHAAGRGTVDSISPNSRTDSSGHTSGHNGAHTSSDITRPQAPLARLV